MATITPQMTTPVPSAFQTTPAYSGTFIPTLWSAKLLAKFYKTTVFSEIANTDYEGEVSKLGDKVIINTIPTISIKNYPEATGNPVQYEVPTPNTVELAVDKAKYFAFQVNDILAYQSDISLMDTFTNDAAMQMKIAIDSSVLFQSFQELNASPQAGANMGATAGANSASLNLGTETAPVDLSVTDEALNLVLRLASVLDEQNAPDEGRFLVIDPLTRMHLFRSKAAQVQVTGDEKSMLRTGRIGTIDRFTIYVSNNLPRLVDNAGTKEWQSGDGKESVAAADQVNAVVGARQIFAGHKTAIAFVSQITKVEDVRNPNDFGDFVRGLHVYGAKLVKPESLAIAIVNN